MNELDNGSSTNMQSPMSLPKMAKERFSLTNNLKSTASTDKYNVITQLDDGQKITDKMHVIQLTVENIKLKSELYMSKNRDLQIP